MVNHRALTASLIDSREFIAARRRADTELLAPAGSRIAFTGGTDCNDHEAICAALDKIRAKHADMVLLHGGSPRGAERCRLLGRSAQGAAGRLQARLDPRRPRCPLQAQ